MENSETWWLMVKGDMSCIMVIGAQTWVILSIKSFQKRGKYI